MCVYREEVRAGGGAKEERVVVEGCCGGDGLGVGRLGRVSDADVCAGGRQVFYGDGGGAGEGWEEPHLRIEFCEVRSGAVWKCISSASIEHVSRAIRERVSP